MTLKATVTIGAAIQQAIALDKGSANFTPGAGLVYSLADGAGANQASQVFSDKRTLAGSANEELDLAGGLTDVFGNTITFTKIKVVIVTSLAANGGDIQVGGSAANGFDAFVGAVGDYVIVKPGGSFAIIAPDVNGYAVTAGTADLLKITNGDASPADYEITIIGTE